MGWFNLSITLSKALVVKNSWSLCRMLYTFRPSCGMMSTQVRFAAALRNRALQITVYQWPVTHVSNTLLAAGSVVPSAVLTRHLQIVYRCQPLVLIVEGRLEEAFPSKHPMRPVFHNNLSELKQHASQMEANYNMKHRQEPVACRISKSITVLASFTSRLSKTCNRPSVVLACARI